ncbi:MAG: type IV pilus modification PilV family protein [Chthoniobacterales bacterium]
MCPFQDEEVPTTRVESRPRTGAFTLVETMVAVAILGLTVFGIMGGIAYMSVRNREASQRMLAASIETEILELFKAQPYPQITNSTAGIPVYLKQVPGGAPDAHWIVPASNAWQAIPVEDVASGTAAAPTLVPDKLPSGEWRADFVTNAATPSLRQITVTLRWQLRGGNSQRLVSLSTSTIVCQSFPSL